MGLELKHISGGTQFHGHGAGCGMRAMFQGQALPIRHTPGSPLRDANSRGSPRHRTRAMNTWHLRQQTPWCGRKILGVGKPAEVGRTQASESPACIQGVGRAPPRTPTLLQTAWCRHLLDGGGSAWVGTFQKKLLAVRSSHQGPCHWVPPLQPQTLGRSWTSFFVCSPLLAR